MPLVESTYHPKFPFKNPHINTVFRTLFKQNTTSYRRERLELEDGDFIDLDNSKVGSDSVVITLHGLEGSANSNYITAATHALNEAGFDVISLNLRGCSGEDNRKFASYHSGKTEDLESLLNYIIHSNQYEHIAILGFSLGGNITLKYLGENATLLHPKISCAVAISVPCDLHGSAMVLAKWSNTLYMRRFLKKLKKKSREKSTLFPENKIDMQAIQKAKNFKDYDAAFTAPANGFSSAEDYWERASSKPHLKNIKIPTLLINSQDDTFLSTSCLPKSIATNHAHLFLETPRFGGHVGFNGNIHDSHWLENRIVGFISKYIPL